MLLNKYVLNSSCLLCLFNCQRCGDTSHKKKKNKKKNTRYLSKMMSKSRIQNLVALKNIRLLWEVPGTPLLEVSHSFGTGQTGIQLDPHFEIHSAGLVDTRESTDVQVLVNVIFLRNNATKIRLIFFVRRNRQLNFPFILYSTSMLVFLKICQKMYVIIMLIITCFFFYLFKQVWLCHV